MALQVGLALDFGRPGVGGGPPTDSLLELIRLAESHGFSSIWAGETYPLGPPTSHLSSPFLALAHIASHTSLQLGTGVILLPAWHPLRLAYDVAVLDRLTGGRLILGVGVGRPALARRFGVDPARVAAYADDTLAALRAFWSGADEYRGSELSLRGPVHPLPTGPAGPPIWVGGTIRRSAVRAASLGDAWYAGTNHAWPLVQVMIGRYREAVAARGGDPSAAIVAVNRLALIAGTGAEARAAATTLLAPTLAAYAARSRAYGEASPETPDSMTYLVGSPDEVIASVRRYAQAGVTHIQIRPFPTGVPFEIARRTVDLVGREVIPALA